MASITQIKLRLVTGNRADASSDGDVFLGVASREFNVDSRDTEYNDFQQGDDRTYIFGEGATVLRPQENDPRSPWQLEFADLRLSPRYIRFEPGPGGDWNLERVELTVIYQGGSATWVQLEGSSHLWLGESRGKAIYL